MEIIFYPFYPFIVVKIIANISDNKYFITLGSFSPGNCWVYSAFLVC